MLTLSMHKRSISRIVRIYRPEIKITCEKQGPCHIFGSRGGINLQLSPASHFG